MSKIQIVHVDDQPRQLKAVKVTMEKFPNVELTSQFTNAEEARDYILKTNPDIAILDIEMPEKDGFWLANEIKSSKALIVFLTAHPDFMLQAFEACAIHYILKPISSKAISEVMAKFEELTKKLNQSSTVQQCQQDQITEVLENYIAKTAHPRRIFINNVHKTTVLNLSEVIYMVSNGPYTIIKTTDGAKHTASKPLKIYYDALQNHPDFSRIHRAHFVNKFFVKAVLRNKHKIFAEMTDGEKLEITPLKRDEIYSMLGL